MIFEKFGFGGEKRDKSPAADLENEAKALRKRIEADKGIPGSNGFQEEYTLDADAAAFVNKATLWAFNIDMPTDGGTAHLREGVTVEWLAQTVGPMIDRVCNARIDNVGPKRKLDLLNSIYLPILPPPLMKQIQDSIMSTQKARKPSEI